MTRRTLMHRKTLKNMRELTGTCCGDLSENSHMWTMSKGDMVKWMKSSFKKNLVFEKKRLVKTRKERFLEERSMCTGLFETSN